ncbi:MAG: tyrosine-type recombinase/integrase [Candidatus Spyradosoma sp.]
MKKAKNIWFSEKAGEKRPFRFEKMVCGRRISRKFATLAQAREFGARLAAEIATQGVEGIGVSAEDRALLRKAKAICGNHDVLEALKWWKRHFHANPGGEKAVSDVWFEFLEWLEKTERSAGHIRNVKATGKRFCAAFGVEALCSVTASRIVEWLLGLGVSPKTQRNFRGDIRGFFSFAKNVKGYIAEIPDVDARVLTRLKKSQTEILNAREAEAVLRDVEAREPEFLPYYALRLFAGLRASEAGKMRGEWIDFGKRTILVPGFFGGERVCKTGEDWLLLPEIIPETVFAWLAPAKKASGAVPVPNHTRREAVSRRFSVPRNALRHTFATMHLALTRDEGKTCLATRHTNIGTFRAHYRGVNQTAAEAAAFWALRPRARA